MRPSYNILVTGCGGDIGQSIGKILKANKLFNKVIGCDLSDEHAGIFIFDKIIKVPRCTADNYVSTLQNIIASEQIDIWLPIAEPELRMMAENGITASFLGKPLICANQKALEVGFDKFRTAMFLKQSSLPFPETFLVEGLATPQLPVVMKSRSGSGSKLVFVVENKEEFAFYQKRHPDFIAQEFLSNSNEEYTCGLFRSKKGDVRTIIYKRKLMGGFSGFGIVQENNAIEDLLVQIAEKLELQGSINVQLRLTNKGPYVFEINPRFSSTVMFRHMMGFEDVLWSIKDAVGLPISDYTKVDTGTKFYKGFTEYVS